MAWWRRTRTTIISVARRSFSIVLWDPSSLTRWRNRIGEEGVEWLLTKAIEAGREAGVISEPGPAPMNEMVVDEPIGRSTFHEF